VTEKREKKYIYKLILFFLLFDNDEFLFLTYLGIFFNIILLKKKVKFSSIIINFNKKEFDSSKRV